MFVLFVELANIACVFAMCCMICVRRSLSASTIYTWFTDFFNWTETTCRYCRSYPFFSLSLEVPGFSPCGVLKHHEVMIHPSSGLQFFLPAPTECVRAVNLVTHNNPWLCSMEFTSSVNVLAECVNIMKDIYWSYRTASSSALLCYPLFK